MGKAKQLDIEEAIAKKQASKGYDENGNFLPDPTVIAPPVGLVRQPSMFERVRELVRSENLRQEAEAAGFESFDDADDFDTGEDKDPGSQYEEVFEGRTSEEILDPERREWERRREAERAPAPKQGGERSPPPPPPEAEPTAK